MLHLYRRNPTWGRFSTHITLLLLLILALAPPLAPAQAQETPAEVAAFPPDPAQDISWSAGTTGLDDVIAAFNNARAAENKSMLPLLRSPGQAAWDAMSTRERALWLINQERSARGLAPFHGLEDNANQVAQAFAQWLLDNDKSWHTDDGKTPWVRLHANPAIGACHDTLNIAENLAFRGTTSADGVPLPLEQAVYDWLYADAGSEWGHRHALLWTPLTENSGPGDREGFIGIGHVRGGHTIQTKRGPAYMPYTDVMVLNIFDPCSSWSYAAPPALPAPPAPPVVPTPVPPPATKTVSGKVTLPTWETVTYQPFERGTWPGAWTVSDNNGATGGNYQWIAATCRVYAGTYSGMAVGGGTNGSQAACGDNYPNQANSWMMYGPFNLTGAIGAEFRSMVWVYTEANHDLLCLVASTDRRVFNGFCVSGYSNGWVPELLDLQRVYRSGNLMGQSQVYVALVFTSDAAVTRPHMGTYADEVTLRRARPAAAASTAATAALPPLYGVTVRDAFGHSAMTDRNGNFKLVGLTPGIHTLTLERDGYTLYPRTLTVDVRSSNVSNAVGVGIHNAYLPVYLPIITHSAASSAQTASSATTASGLHAQDATFHLVCGADGCQMIGPLEEGAPSGDSIFR